MWEKGFDNGSDAAIGVCFGCVAKPAPYFETPDDELDYLEGYEAGFDSVDD